MPDIEDFQIDAERNDDDVTSDVNSRQKPLSIWQWPLTFGPFVILIAVAQFPVSNAIPTGLFVALIMIAVVWAVAFQGYLLYLKYQSS